MTDFNPLLPLVASWEIGKCKIFAKILQFLPLCIEILVPKIVIIITYAQGRSQKKFSEG